MMSAPFTSRSPIRAVAYTLRWRSLESSIHSTSSLSDSLWTLSTRFILHRQKDIRCCVSSCTPEIRHFFAPLPKSIPRFAQRRQAPLCIPSRPYLSERKR
eukprot:00216_2